MLYPSAPELIARLPDVDFVVADKDYDSEPIWALPRSLCLNGALVAGVTAYPEAPA